jgi:hypothetical protein
VRLVIRGKSPICYEQETEIVTTLDEFPGPLNDGVWEVIVLKDPVTEPLDPGWVKSPINVPAPGTIARYRKCRIFYCCPKPQFCITKGGIVHPRDFKV